MYSILIALTSVAGLAAAMPAEGLQTRAISVEQAAKVIAAVQKRQSGGCVVCLGACGASGTLAGCGQCCGLCDNDPNIGC